MSTRRKGKFENEGASVFALRWVRGREGIRGLEGFEKGDSSCALFRILRKSEKCGDQSQVRPDKGLPVSNDNAEGSAVHN